MRTVDVQKLGISLTERIAMEMGNVVEIVDDSVQNVFSLAMDNSTLMIELAARSMN